MLIDLLFWELYVMKDVMEWWETFTCFGEWYRKAQANLDTYDGWYKPMSFIVTNVCNWQ